MTLKLQSNLDVGSENIFLFFILLLECIAYNIVDAGEL